MSPSFKSLVVLLTATVCVGSAVAREPAIAAYLKPLQNPDNPKDIVSLAVKYEHAEGLPRDYEKAAALYCRAARSGYSEAQYALGWMYANGRGVKKNDSIAAQLFALAAEQGHIQAHEMMRYTASSTTSPLPDCLLPDKALPVGEDQQGAEVSYPKGNIFNLVYKLAPHYDVDPKLAMAVISVESGFNVMARSPKNAQGLMQLIPATAQRFRVKNAFDAEDNIKGGLAYLQWLLAYFKGEVSLVAAAYNAGEGAVEKYRGVPPYFETQNYVKKIIALYKKSSHPYKQEIVKASAIALAR